VKVYYYSDPVCGANHVAQEDRYAVGCAYKIEDYYYSDTSYSLSLSCTEGVNARYPSSQGFAGKYAIQR
jgi:hypothetical protein